MPALSRIAWAQTYPTRPVRIIVGFAPGGTNDILARLIGQWLSERLGQPLVVENRPGAGSNTATEAVVRAPADGYTLLLVQPAAAINATLYEKLNFNFIRDIAPVAGIVSVPLVMLVNPSVPARTIPEFITYAKANPGRINMASAGTGTAPHVAGELFKMMAGIDMIHVPYRGAGPAMTDLLPGRVQLMFDNLPSSIEHIRAGRLRALGVTASTRAPALPDVPTIGETVPGYEVSVWNGISVPKGTPPEVIDTLNRAVNAVLANPRLQARFADLGGAPMPMTPAEFGNLVVAETAKWAKVVKLSGAKPE
jgi:tripartite-type tricarboxylate transporter receptor subunit TctC